MSNTIVQPVIPVTQPVAPAVQPVVAPVTAIPDFNAPVDKPRAPVKDDEPVAVDTPEFEQTGNSQLDIAINSFAKLTGATQKDIDRATKAAVSYGDPGLVDEVFLKERFGANADVAIKLAKEAVADSVKQSNEAIATVHAAAGGQAQWDSAVSVFNTKATPALKSAVKLMMNNGDVKGGTELLLNYVKDSGLLPNVNPLLNTGGTNLGVSTGLNAGDFKKEMADLTKRAGNRSLEQGPFAAEYNQLLARRQAGKKLGFN
jgi:hypothetical protein